MISVSADSMFSAAESAVYSCADSRDSILIAHKLKTAFVTRRHRHDMINSVCASDFRSGDLRQQVWHLAKPAQIW
jgi:hypothetical protein